MKMMERIRGIARVELCGAFPEAALNACALNSVELRELECVDACTLRATVYETQLPQLRRAAQSAMCECRVLSTRGGSGNRRFLRRRLGLLIGAALVAALLVFSSFFLWEIEVQGCETLSKGEVLRALADCGVERGRWWPSLSADLVRSRMMAELPQIGWMTVNVSGSRAVVLIAERQEKPEIYRESAAADLVAAKTGIVSRLSVLSGQALVSPGQSVVAGETLISGAVDSITNPTRFVRARASVMADTWYELTAVCPLETAQKGEPRSHRSRFALKIGKNRVNFYFGSGKALDECDKIVHEYTVGIPGVFALPVTLVREEQLSREQSPAASGLETQLREDLLTMLPGEIVSSAFTASRSGGLLTVTLRAHCCEDIAQLREYGEGERAP